MSRIDIAGRSNRAGNASEPAPEARASEAPKAERRAADAAAERRRNSHFGTAPGRRSNTDVAGAVKGAGGQGSSDPDAIAAEVFRLRAESATATDAGSAREMGQRLHALSNRWCELARARGTTPPSDAFDPAQASDAELRSALLWTEVGNTYPVGALLDGGARFQRELHLALIVRSPALLERAITSSKGNDPSLLRALYKELCRLGDARPCAPTDTLASLASRRAAIVRRREAESLAAENEQARRQKTIGLDGRVGTAEWVIQYELEQGIVAANPGSFLGTIGAGISASHGGSIEDRRRAGRAGNAAQGLLGFARPGDPDKKPPPPNLNESSRRSGEVR